MTNRAHGSRSGLPDVPESEAPELQHLASSRFGTGDETSQGFREALTGEWLAGSLLFLGQLEGWQRVVAEFLLPDLCGVVGSVSQFLEKEKERHR